MSVQFKKNQDKSKKEVDVKIIIMLYKKLDTQEYDYIIEVLNDGTFYNKDFLTMMWKRLFE